MSVIQSYLTSIYTVIMRARSEGLKLTFRRYGWKLVAFVFCYYLIRDTFLYILMPYLIVSYLTQ